MKPNLYRTSTYVSGGPEQSPPASRSAISGHPGRKHAKTLLSMTATQRRAASVRRSPRRPRAFSRPLTPTRLQPATMERGPSENPGQIEQTGRIWEGRKAQEAQEARRRGGAENPRSRTFADFATGESGRLRDAQGSKPHLQIRCWSEDICLNGSHRPPWLAHAQGVPPRWLQRGRQAIARSSKPREAAW